MNAYARVIAPPSKLSGRYLAALTGYLAKAPGSSLTSALRMGRESLAAGQPTLALAIIHEKALGKLLEPIDTAVARNRLIKRSGVFFAEALVPLEETHRYARDTASRMTVLNASLQRRADELLASNRSLEKEVRLRKKSEDNLRKSESRSTELLEEARHMRMRMQGLSRSILATQEEERKRISRELHDVIAQMLAGINLRLENLRKESLLNAHGIGKKIAHTQKLVEKSVEVVHRFALALRPTMLDDLGLIPALHALLKDFAKLSGLQVRLTAFAGVEEMSGAKRTVLYRVVQEALGNINQHAKANRVEVEIQKLAKSVRMRVKDDGISFDVAQMWHGRKNRHLGILGMRERVEMVGGSFAIDSAPDRGTTLEILIPFVAAAKSQAKQ
jgi:signal transduction histidine kinase